MSYSGTYKGNTLCKACVLAPEELKWKPPANASFYDTFCPRCGGTCEDAYPEIPWPETPEDTARKIQMVKDWNARHFDDGYPSRAGVPAPNPPIVD